MIKIDYEQMTSESGKQKRKTNKVKGLLFLNEDYRMEVFALEFPVFSLCS